MDIGISAIMSRGSAAASRAILRHGVAALLLAILLAAGDWPPLAAALIGFFLGAAVARMAVEVLRGLEHSALDGVAGRVDAVRRDLQLRGRRARPDPGAAVARSACPSARKFFSLYAMIVALLTIVCLFAAIRLANRVIGHAILRTDRASTRRRSCSRKSSPRSR